MKKIAISLCLFLLLNLCGCSLVPVGTNTSNIETLKSGSFLRVGRVIVPIVKAIYDRDMAIKNFVPEKYYSISINQTRY